MQRGNSVWYKSPFRTEKEASFKVDLHKELWYDFGLGKGGDIITLAKEIYRTQDIGYVLQCIEDKRAVLK
ncbi:CHC2 zinc finger domain-containing protein [Phocaeicola dorei]|nr:CHC2 zinc finger domain-containing protein [Phocaeicola dorei]